MAMDHQIGREVGLLRQHDHQLERQHGPQPGRPIVLQPGGLPRQHDHPHLPLPGNPHRHLPVSQMDLAGLPPDLRHQPILRDHPVPGVEVVVLVEVEAEQAVEVVEVEDDNKADFFYTKQKRLCE